MVWNALAADAVPRNPSFVGWIADQRTDRAHDAACAPDARGEAAPPLTIMTTVCREGDIAATDSPMLPKS